MKAVLRRQPGEVILTDRPIPEPGPGEVLVRLRACGICGSDVARLRDADEKWNHVVLGHECCGLIESLGPASPLDTGDSRLATSPGQRVALLPLLPDFSCPFCARGDYSLCDNYSFVGSRQDGGLAEYLVAPLGNFLPIPDEVSDEAAAMLEPLSVATQGCLLGGLRPGQSVLVMGAGAIGLLAVQVALALGASPVVACDVVPEKLTLAAALGAETVLLPSDTLDLKLPPCDLALECSGHHSAFGPALASVAKGGTLVLVGTGPGEVTLSGAQREQICRRMLTVRGQWMSYGPTWPGEPWTIPLQLLAAGRLDPTRLITHRYALAQAAEAVRFMLTPGAEYLKVMVFND
jgi:L-iditol 2-dehydrogenase